MGMDIHMKLIDNRGNILIDEIYNGRCREWFNNLMGKNIGIYDNLPTTPGIPDFADKETISAFEDEGSYFGFYYMNAGKYYEWYKKYKPYLYAGWASIYEIWLHETRDYKYYDLPYDLPNAYPPENYKFVEYEDKYDCNSYVIRKLKDKFSFPDFEKYTIVYYFDN